MQIYLASGNAHKAQEIEAILGDGISVLSMSALGQMEDLPETQLTISGNAIQKALYLHQKYGVDCIADDTGLLIDSLGGAPGVYSARYAGPQRNAADNMQLVLQKLDGLSDRAAHFETVLALVLDGELYTFRGRVYGHIAQSPSGTGGFGYDPVFIPQGYTQSFGELPAAVKHSISHRARALQQLLQFVRPFAANR